MDLNTIWYLLIGVLMFAYAALDGFDLGVGVMHLFAPSETQRRTNMAAVGPVWDGNEVWLLTVGGAMFAAFPAVYATTFSGFYLAFILLLVALIFRAVSLEFRAQVDSTIWKRFWDISFGLGSLVPALLFGVAVGNVLQGLPIEADGSLDLPFVALLNPYALLVGVLSLAMLVMQGGAYLAARSEGDLCRWAARWGKRSVVRICRTLGGRHDSYLLHRPIFVRRNPCQAAVLDRFACHVGGHRRRSHCFTRRGLRAGPIGIIAFDRFPDRTDGRKHVSPHGAIEHQFGKQPHDLQRIVDASHAHRHANHCALGPAFCDRLHRADLQGFYGQNRPEQRTLLRYVIRITHRFGFVPQLPMLPAGVMRRQTKRTGLDCRSFCSHSTKKRL